MDEFVLCEAQRSLLKLLRDVDDLHLARASMQALTSPPAPEAACTAAPDGKLHRPVGLSLLIRSRAVMRVGLEETWS